MADKRPPGSSGLKVPEPPTGLRAGFLTDYWRYEKQLPTMSGVELYTYYLTRGVENITAQPGSSLITVLTMAVSLFLLAGFLLLVQNVDRVLTSSGSSFQITAFLKDPLDETRIAAFVQEIGRNPLVRRAQYMSKKQALEFLRRELDSKQALVEGLELNNPLPASIEVIVRPMRPDLDAVEQVVALLRASDLVDEVLYGSEWVNRAQVVIRIFRTFGAGTLLLTLTIVAFLISNTIRLVMFARRDEIDIMQLVGASRQSITSPFILGGLIQGVVGSIAGLLVLKAGFWLLNTALGESLVFGVTIPELTYLSPYGVVGMLILGAVAGSAGSFFALRRYLHI